MPLILTRDTLHRELARHLPPPALAWLDQQLGDPLLLADRPKLRVAYARVARKLGSAGERHVQVEGAEAPWSLTDLARAELLLTALDAVPEGDHVELIAELYRTGALGEQRSILRALPLLANGADFVAIGVEACRTNSPAVFAAIASDNPFPAEYFPDLHFNQLVLKAIFLSVPVARIHDLSRRATPELRRMVSEYANERRAAGRPVPEDVDHVLALTSAP